MGPIVERVPAQRVSPLPRRRFPSGVRDRRMRRLARSAYPGPGRRGTDDRPAGQGADRARSRRHRRTRTHGQEQHGRRWELLRLPRELPHPPHPRLQPTDHGAAALPRLPAAARRSGSRDPSPFGLRPRRGSRPVGDDVRSLRPFRRHVGGSVVGDDTVASDHQRPRRTARGCGEVPTVARHRR